MMESTFPTDNICLYLLGKGGSPPQVEQPPHSPADPAPEGVVLFQGSELLSCLSWEPKSEKFSQNKLMKSKSGTEMGEGRQLGS